MQQKFSLRDLVPMLAIDVAMPYCLYVILSPDFPSNSLIPLLIAGLPPMISNIVSIIRKGHIDFIGALVILGTLISVVAALVTGDQKVFLIRESFLTAAIGIACLVSLLFPKPLMFYLGRQFMASGDPTKVAYFNSLWQYPSFRFANYLITIVWGIGLLLEVVIRIILVYTLSVAQVLAIAPIIFNGMTIGLILWTVAYGSRVRRKRQAQNTDQDQPEAVTAAASLSVVEGEQDSGREV